MSVARITSRGQVGLDAPLVHVEVNLASGLPVFNMVGLPAKAVKESKERVRAAIVNSNFDFPAGRITVNLAPADLPKEGGRFDLPIALGILLASGQIKIPAALDANEFYGELGLSGELKPVTGLMLAATHAARVGHEMIVPNANVDETRVAARGAVRGANDLLEVCGHVQSAAPLPLCVESRAPAQALGAAELDLRDVRGQAQAKRALSIAAAAGHSLLMVGPPGTGKSMLARRLPGLLPPLTDEEALEVAGIASVSATGFDARTFGRRPFRSPHHTTSAHAIVGGGSHAKPGEVSLAHRGILFLDELPEFERRVLEALREPLETGVICVSRAAMQAEYPAWFQLVAAMNPCPCGYWGDPDESCRCTPPEIHKYRGRISGPLLDRIDMHIEVPRVPASELLGECSGASSAEIAALALAARTRQLKRAGKLNSSLNASELRVAAQIESAAIKLLEATFVKLRLSARSYHSILRVALTIADLANAKSIERNHIAEAIQLRRAMRPIELS